MATVSQPAATLSARRFAEGLLAGLAVNNQRQIPASQLQLHRAFRTVLKNADECHGLHVDVSDVDYDPLYGLSGWLDEFLARAQRDLLISSPNPSYGRIEIKVSPSEGEQILEGYPNGALFKELSKLFVEELRA